MWEEKKVGKGKGGKKKSREKREWRGEKRGGAGKGERRIYMKRSKISICFCAAQTSAEVLQYKNGQTHIQGQHEMYSQINKSTTSKKFLKVSGTLALDI